MMVPQGNAVINGPQSLLTIRPKSILPNPPFLLLLLLLLNSTFLWTPASAQSPSTPIPATKAEYTYHSVNKTLFIRGGLNGTKDVSQFYSLDLSPLKFHFSNLPWRHLFPGGAFPTYGEKMPVAVIQREGGTVVYFGQGRNMSDYSVVYDHWRSLPTPTCGGTPGATDLVRSSHTALADPKTDLIYIPYAYGGGNEMLVFNDENNTCSGLPMPASSIGNYYAWSDIKSAIYMLGDTVPATGPTMWEFLPSTKGWKKIPVKGSPPTALWGNSCMVSVLGGLRLLLFGGNNSDKATGDMFVFDTDSYSWTKAATSPNVRTEMVCASADDYFITWGGTDLSSTATSSIPMLFYNIVNNKWLKQEADSTFSDALSPSASATSTGSGSVNTDLPITDTSASGSNKPAIGGGVAAVVVVIAALVGLFFYRRHNRQSGTPRHPQDLKRSSLVPPDNSGTIVSSETHLDRKAAPHAVLGNTSLGQQQKHNVNAEYLEAAGDGGEAFVSLHGQQGPQYHPPSPQPYMCDHIRQQQHQQPNKPSLFPKRVHRGPQVQHNDAPIDPLEQIALIEAKYEQDREQLRQNQQAALERVRQQWQDDMAARALRTAGNETQ